MTHNANHDVAPLVPHATNTRSGTACHLNLYNELFWIICGFLSRHDLYAATAVCTHWSHLFRAMPSLDLFCWLYDKTDSAKLTRIGSLHAHIQRMLVSMDAAPAFEHASFVDMFPRLEMIEFACLTVPTEFPISFPARLKECKLMIEKVDRTGDALGYVQNLIDGLAVCNQTLVLLDFILDHDVMISLQPDNDAIANNGNAIKKLSFSAWKMPRLRDFSFGWLDAADDRRVAIPDSLWVDFLLVHVAQLVSLSLLAGYFDVNTLTSLTDDIDWGATKQSALQRLDFSLTAVSGESLARIAPIFSNLTEFSPCRLTMDTDALFRPIRAFTHCTTLRCTLESTITLGALVDALAHLSSSLTSLQLGHSGLDNETLVQILHAVPKLRRLTLGRCIHLSSLEWVTHVSSLQLPCLEIGECEMSLAELRHLRCLSHAEEFYFFQINWDSEPDALTRHMFQPHSEWFPRLVSCIL